MNSKYIFKQKSNFMALSVLVIGGGITGISTAELLRREGVSVTVIDKVYPGDPQQASYGNAGLLASSAIIPISSPGIWKKIPYYLFARNSPLSINWLYLPKLLPWLLPFLKNSNKKKFIEIVSSLNNLTYDSVDQHLELSKGTKASKYIKLGTWTLLYPSEEDFLKDRYENNLQQKHGFIMEYLNRKELLKRDPLLGQHYNYGAEFKNHGWLTSPGSYMKELAKHFEQNGGKFIKEEVVDILDNKVITKLNNSYEADKIVISAGAWSGKILKFINHKTNLETERGYHLILKDVNYMPSNPYAVSDLGFAITPMNDGLRCAGTTELGGLKAKPSYERVEILRDGVKKLYPKLEWQNEEIWMGHRPTTPDCMPVIGQSEKLKNTYFAFGGQHIGLTIGPKIGRIITDLILDKKTNTSITEFRNSRF